MNVRELKELLNHHDDEAVVVMWDSFDAELYCVEARHIQHEENRLAIGASDRVVRLPSVLVIEL